TSGSPSTNTNTNIINATTNTRLAFDASRGDRRSIGGRQGVETAGVPAGAVASRTRSITLPIEDGFLSSSDSDRSCSPGPVRRVPRGENASPWGEETVSPFRRLCVSDRQ
ncbi:unnamed protein product, partial [Laminaria digitata]